MEKCTRKVNSYAVTRSVYLMGLFDWKMVKEEKKENGPSTLYFERDEKVPYYEEMVEIEKEISPHMIPFWTLIIPVGISFSLVTAYLICYLTLKPNFDTMKFFFIFFLPAMAFLLLDTLLFFIRSKQLMKYLQDEQNIVKKAEDKMADLRKRYKAPN